MVLFITYLISFTHYLLLSLNANKKRCHGWTLKCLSEALRIINFKKIGNFCNINPTNPAFYEFY